jgi:hypothetical protein
MTYELDARVIRIVRGLWSRNVAGNTTRWERRVDRSGREIFDYSTTNSTVAISKDNDGDVIIEFLDERGAIIDSVGEWEADAGAPEWWRKAFHELYATARRSALRVDKRLDQLDVELGES